MFRLPPVTIFPWLFMTSVALILTSSWAEICPVVFFTVFVVKAKLPLVAIFPVSLIMLLVVLSKNVPVPAWVSSPLLLFMSVAVIFVSFPDKASFPWLLSKV